MTQLATFSALRRRISSLLRPSRLAIASAVDKAGALPSLIVFAAAMVIVPALGPIKSTIPLSAETSINVVISRTSILGVVVVCALVWILPLFHARQITEPAARFESVLKGREHLFHIVAAVALLLGVLVTWTQFQYTANSNERVIIATREAQVTERLARAVEMLGKEDIAVRVGALYALERLARDSPKDYRTVMELLLTVVREHAPLPRPADVSPSDRRHDRQLVQAAMTIIGRRTLDTDETRPYPHWRLSGTDLTDLWLSRGNYAGFTFMGADLSGSVLIATKLSGASFEGAVMQSVQLNDASLDRADFMNADLTCSSMQNVDASGSRFYGTRMIGASLSGKLAGAKFNYADLTSGSLFGDVGGARFERLIFQGAWVTATNWEKASVYELVGRPFEGRMAPATKGYLAARGITPLPPTTQFIPPTCRPRPLWPW
jgi:uncharacterized protein YjbI with pentapeptide repeats